MWFIKRLSLDGINILHPPTTEHYVFVQHKYIHFFSLSKSLLSLSLSLSLTHSLTHSFTLSLSLSLSPCLVLDWSKLEAIADKNEMLRKPFQNNPLV